MMELKAADTLKDVANEVPFKVDIGLNANEAMKGVMRLRSGSVLVVTTSVVTLEPGAKPRGMHLKFELTVPN